MCVPPVENPTCAAFEEYKEVPEIVPLDFSEEDVMWVASKLSGAAGVLRAKAIDLGNWLLCSRCVSEDFRVVVSNMAYWMADYSLPWVAYFDIMVFRLVSLDKCPGVHSVGIGETLHCAIFKLVMRTAGDHLKTARGSLQLCAGIEAGI